MVTSTHMPNWRGKPRRSQLYTKDHREQRKAGGGGPSPGKGTPLVVGYQVVSPETYIQIATQTEQVTLRNKDAYSID